MGMHLAASLQLETMHASVWQGACRNPPKPEEHPDPHSPVTNDARRTEAMEALWSACSCTGQLRKPNPQALLHLTVRRLELMQAAAHGVPTVATKNGGPVDIMQTLHHGILVDPTDSKAIADALLRILTNSSLWDEYSQSGMSLHQALIQASSMPYEWRTCGCDRGLSGPKCIDLLKALISAVTWQWNIHKGELMLVALSWRRLLERREGWAPWGWLCQRHRKAGKAGHAC